MEQEPMGQHANRPDTVQHKLRDTETSTMTK